MTLPHQHADGSEEFGTRPVEQQVAMQNAQAARVTAGEVRMLFGQWIERAPERRMVDNRCADAQHLYWSGSNLRGWRIRICRRKTDRRAA